jgi:antitoxin ParD1/3/4
MRYKKSMSITLTPEQQAWLRAHVERGDFASIEDAMRQLIAEIAAQEGDDLAWAKPYVEEALADVARGDVMTLEEHEARNDARLAAMQAKCLGSSSRLPPTLTPQPFWTTSISGPGG